MEDLSYDYDSDPETGEPRRDGFGRTKKKGPKQPSRSKEAIRIQFKFIEMCKKEIGISPIMNKAGYVCALRAIDKGGLTEAQIYDLFEEWFGFGKPDDETVSLTRALSDNQINGYRARNQIY